MREPETWALIYLFLNLCFNLVMMLFLFSLHSLVSSGGSHEKIWDCTDVIGPVDRLQAVRSYTRIDASTNPKANIHIITNSRT